MQNKLFNVVLGPLTRNALRYLIGYLLAKNFIPDEVVQVFTDSPQAVTTIETAVCVAAGVGVEKLYLLAKKRGWAH